MPSNPDMPSNPAQNTVTDKSKDAATNALAREKDAERQAAPGEVPVKQHNPGDKGLNPDQRGPAQPEDSGRSGQGAG